MCRIGRGRIPAGLLAVALGLVSSGCGNGDVPVSGLVRMNGQPIQLPPSENAISVTFLELKEGGGRTDFAYMTAVQPGGTFTVPGPDRKGIPKGRYRVALNGGIVPVGVKLPPDKFWTPYGSDNSPFTVDVGSGDGELVLDLDAPGSGK